MTETILRINGVGFPLGSARGITHALDPVENGELRRTINGRLVNLTRTTHRKYIYTATCRDMSTPTFGRLWRGQVLSVECGIFLRELATSANHVLERTPVANTVRATDVDGNIKPTSLSTSTVSITGFSGQAFIQYRPILQMMVSQFSQDFDEYGAVEGWNLELIEV